MTKSQARPQATPKPAKTACVPKRCLRMGKSKPTAVLKANWEPSDDAMAADRQRVGNSSEVKMFGKGVAVC